MVPPRGKCLAALYGGEPVATVNQPAQHHQEVEGILEQVLFANDVNGYAIGLFEITDEGQRRRITVVGS
jgi:hypothetical protein